MFTRQQQLIASLLHMDLDNPLMRKAFRSLPSGHDPKSRRAVARSRYTPAGPARNCGRRGISPKGLRPAA